MSVSNHQFAAKVSCNYTMASRLRSGQRLPSAGMLGKICDAYSLDKGVALTMWQGGAEQFSSWLRKEVFDRDEPLEEDAA